LDEHGDGLFGRRQRDRGQASATHGLLAGGHRRVGGELDVMALIPLLGAMGAAGVGGQCRAPPAVDPRGASITWT